MIRRTGRKKVGLAPGSVVYTGERKVEVPTVDLIRYSSERIEERRDLPLAEALVPPAEGEIAWINVNGLHDTELIERLGERFGLHPLTLEDLVSVGQRPKVEEYDRYLFLVVRMLDARDGTLENEQLGLVLGPNFLLTFQERPGDVFEPVRERLRSAKGRIRKLGSDYLAYALVDVIVDTYFTLLEGYSDAIEDLEEVVFDAPEPSVLERINRLKRETLFVRKAVWPVREVIGRLLHEETQLISSTVHTFLRDSYDHIIQAIDAIETQRDLLVGLQDAYLSSLSYRMNEVMKVLTIIATVFIPLSFVVGVYGMNFDHMPELHLRWGYPALWGVMLALTAGLLFYFRRRRWL